MFEKWQNAVLGHLFPSGLRCLGLKSVRIPASNRLAWQKNLHQSRIPPFFKQDLVKNNRQKGSIHHHGHQNRPAGQSELRQDHPVQPAHRVQPIRGQLARRHRGEKGGPPQGPSPPPRPKRAVRSPMCSPAAWSMLAHIEESIQDMVDGRCLRWYAIKLFERDEKVLANLDGRLSARLEEHIADCERELDDDAESIITNQRYACISRMVGQAVTKKAAKHSLSASDKIDRIVTNRFLALPIFAGILFGVYALAMGGWPVSLGARGTDWANDVLFGEWVPDLFGRLLAFFHVAEGSALHGLVQDGIVAGVGAVLGFVPQMLVLFLLLAVLEDVGYMARVAFIMDRIFRRFGLSGKSFIPMLVATGCGVPGIMASRTIEQDRDRKMTVMTTGFIPCGAKLPIIGLFAGAVFGGSAWVSVSAFFIGIAAVVLSGIMLKKFRAFAGEPAPFVMELPAYHAPSAGGVLRAAWERGWSFIKRAGTVILLSSIILWFLQGYGFVDGAFQAVEDNSTSLLAALGRSIAWVFAPIGWEGGMAWKAAVVTITGLIAKEVVVTTFGVLYRFAGEKLGNSGEAVWSFIAADFGPMTAYSFLIFNLLCAPCFAAMGAIKREMNNARWTAAAIGYMCAFAYAVSLIVFQLGGLVTGEARFGLGTITALALPASLVYLLVRRGYPAEAGRRPRVALGCGDCASCGGCGRAS